MPEKIDRLIIEFDNALRTLFGDFVSHRPHPDDQLVDLPLTPLEQKKSIGLMRVNHCGEICAQALYQGQSLTARYHESKGALQQASLEESEHLAWTARRIHELGGRTSIFNPIWYIGSLTIGVTAGILGDHWNLGFLEETENQVCDHLKSHLSQLPANDKKSRAIVTQMLQDEKKHAVLAKNLGANPLPKLVQRAMKKTAKIMTKTSYYF